MIRYLFNIAYFIVTIALFFEFVDKFIYVIHMYNKCLNQ